MCAQKVSSHDKETLDHQSYIKEVLSVAKNYEDKVFGNDWMVQGHTYISVVRIAFQILLINIIDHHIDPLDYCIRDELVQQMNCDKIESKRFLIDELRCGVDKKLC